MFRLYRNANQYADQPCVWEGLFRIACLITSKPENEPVAACIINAGSDSENGSFPGNFTGQVHTARALFALFEYNTDRVILRRIAEWLRYVEIEFDAVTSHDSVLYQPADLMELLVRFYLVTGSKTALRLCIKLRAGAFDWTTALHTFQQSIPIHMTGKDEEYCIPAVNPEEMDFAQKEKLINHAELLADGVRYTLFSGLFSGHGQDLSSGKAVWDYLLKHHHALCGGTTGTPFLSGNAPDRPVSNRVLCAWAEAFAAQMIPEDCSWATEELIRIVYNGLDECLNHEELSSVQRINSIDEQPYPPDDPAGFYARLTRAEAALFSHAVALNENGFRLNYLLPARYMIMSRNRPLVIRMDGESAVFQCKNPVSAYTELFMPNSGTCSMKISRQDQDPVRLKYEERKEGSSLTRTDTEWNDQDRIVFEPGNHVCCEHTHHQGMAFLMLNRLLCLPATEKDFCVAVKENPVISEKTITVSVARAESWQIRNNQPADIPVMPETKGERAEREMMFYSSCRNRIAMFPRSR